MIEDVPENKFGIYIDLDSLFDTRMGTVCEINPELIPIVLTEGYLTRVEDNFPPLKKESFKEVYNLRDCETLRLSPVTNCFRLLDELVKSGLGLSTTGPSYSGVKIYLNTYPFNLSEVEAGDILSLLVGYSGKLASVEIYNVSPDKLTVDFVDKYLDVMVMYDYNTWLDSCVISGEIKKKSLCEVLLIGPKLYHHKVPTDQEMRKMEKTGITPFKAAEMMASPLIKLQLGEIDIFSVNIDEYKKNKNT